VFGQTVSMPTRPPPVSFSTSSPSTVLPPGSSVEAPIAESNIGRHLLRNMGWTEGSTLGFESDSGLLTPLAALGQTGRRGLGYSL